MLPLRPSLLLLVFLFACDDLQESSADSSDGLAPPTDGDPGGPPPEGGSRGDGGASGDPSEGSGGSKSPGKVGLDRGPRLLEVDGDPNGLYWDAPRSTLLVADDNGNRILAWDDERGFSLVAELPAAAPQGAGLGQLVLTGDGALVVTRFGYGTAGDVVWIPAGGAPRVVPELDVQRRRIGLTVTREGELYDSWFVRLSTGDRVGAVGKLSLEGTEVEVVTGLQKPVGVLAVDSDLFIADQDLGQILRAPLSNPSAFTVFATVEAPDLLGAGPNGSLFAGSAGGSVYCISPAGAPTVFESGFQQVRGVAYDADNRRLFVAEHDPDESDGTNHLLHILPVD